MQRLERDPSDQEWDRFVLRVARIKHIRFRYGHEYEFHYTQVKRMHPRIDSNVFSKIITRMRSMHKGQLLFPRLESLCFKHHLSVHPEHQIELIQEQLCTANDFGNPTSISFDNLSLQHSTLLAISKMTSIKTLYIRDDSTYSQK